MKNKYAEALEIERAILEELTKNRLSKISIRAMQATHARVNVLELLAHRENL